MADALEIYKLAVEMADRVSSRRITANTFFVTVETALLALATFFLPSVTDDGRQFALVTICLVGVILSCTWFLTIRSYRRLNRAKFAVINQIEKALSLQYFTEEWKHLKGSDDITEPKTVRQRWVRFADRYTDLTLIETAVPLLFGVLNAAAVLAILTKVIK